MAIYELARARRELATEALSEIEGMRHGHFVEPRALDAVKEEYQRRVSEAEAQLEKVELDRGLLLREETAEVRRRVLLFERNHLMEARQHGMMGDEAYNRLLADVDARLLECDSGESRDNARQERED
jgi:CPA1 family monovalent cation:H+ antiporter